MFLRHIRHFRCMLSIVATALSLGASITFAAGQDGPPPTDGEPLVVKVNVVVLDVDAIDDADQSFKASTYYQLSWRDPRLATTEDQPLPPEIKIWRPQVGIVNAQSSWTVMPEDITVTRDGTVYMQRHIWASFSQPLDLRKFPFDRQDFTIRLISSVEPDKLVFIQDPNNMSKIADNLSVPDWQVVAEEASGDVYDFAEGAVLVPSFAFTFTAERLSQYYVLTMILPLVVIVSMSFVTFWISESGYPARIGTASTAMLTIITYRAAAVHVLPRTNYFTDLDIFIAGCTVLVFSALIVVAVAIFFERTGQEDKARLIDRRTRYIFPLAFLAILGFTFLGPQSSG